MYQKEIIYMGLHKDGSRLGSAGFLKVENRDTESTLYLKVKNIPHSINGRFPVRFYNGVNWKEVDGITLQEGNGLWEEHETETLKQVRLQIILPSGYLIEGVSKEALQKLHEGSGSGGSAAGAGVAAREAVPERAGRTEKEVVSDRANTASGEVMSDEADTAEREVVPGRTSTAAREAVSDRASMIEREAVANRTGTVEREIVSNEAGAAERETMTGRVGTVEREVVSGRAGVAEQETVSGRAGAAEQETVSGRAGVAEQETVPVERNVGTKRTRTEPVRTVEHIPVQRQRSITKGKISEGSAMVSEELPPPMADQMQMNGVKEDKWEQILDTYDQIHPYGDERVYVKLEPKDFVILQAKYQHLVNNSFLLHGFYNYRYVILGKENDYYLGVPGVFYEREKMVALMFGFEAFECQSGEAKPGEFGYYLRKVEL